MILLINKLILLSLNNVSDANHHDGFQTFGYYFVQIWSNMNDCEIEM